MTEKLTSYPLAIIAGYRQSGIALGNHYTQTRCIADDRRRGAEMQVKHAAAKNAALAKNSCVIRRQQQTMLRTKTEFVGHRSIRHSNDDGLWHDARE